MSKILDIHTHNSGAENAIINLDIFNPVLEEGRFYSVGVHPWYTTDVEEAEKLFETVKQLASHHQVVAIGETGVDKLRGGELSVQEEFFRKHIKIAESVRKPLILHVVKAYPEIIKERMCYTDMVDWIIHGFRGKPELAQELLRHGFYLSLGEKYNDSTADIIPSSRLLIETDTSAIDIEALAARHPQLDFTLPDKIFKKQ